MPIIKAINSSASLKQTLDYITKEEDKNHREKTNIYLVGTHNMNTQNFLREMEDVKHEFHKLGGQTQKHYVISFKPNENITPEKAMDFAQEFIEKTKQFNDRQIAYACHEDKDHLHVHLVVNTVSFIDGRKLDSNREFLNQCKEKVVELSHSYKIDVVNIPETKDLSKNKQKEKESQAKFRNMLKRAKEEHCFSNIWKNTMAQEVARAIILSESKEEFIKTLNRDNYFVNWKPTKADIVIEDKDGHKSRADKLRKLYSPDFPLYSFEWKTHNLEKIFDRNRKHLPLFQKETAEPERPAAVKPKPKEKDFEMEL